MIVVADTTPLNYLIRLGYPGILPKLYGRVVVPPAVLVEMLHPEAPAEVQAWATSPPDWLEEIPVHNLDASLAHELGMGERQAISLALELDADLLLIDELAGRQQARERHIFVAGTLSILLQASLQGYCHFPDAVKQLRQHGFWMSTSMEADIMDRYFKASNPQ